MATIDYEKKYKEALEKARQLCAYPTTKPFISDLQDLFPELAESEDERMIQYFKDLAPFDKADELYEKYGFSHKDAIAWLEKQVKQSKKHDVCDTCDEKDSCISPCCVKLVEEQGGQKPVGFNIGDEITVNGQVCRIVAVDNLDWSKEDEAVWSEISDLLWEGYKQSGSKFSWDDIRNWANSKLKYIKPQKTWKPSDEQMKALSNINVTGCISYAGQGQELVNLYNDLKKLSEG